MSASGKIYVADGIRHLVQEFDPNGNYLNQVGGIPGGYANYNPYGVYGESNGNVYVANTTNGHLEEYDSNGVFIRRIGIDTVGSNTNLSAGGMIGSSQWNNESNTVDIQHSTANMNIIIADPNSRINSVIAGGVIGFGFGSINSTISHGNITLSGSNGYYVGGMSGYFAGQVTNSHASNDIFDSSG